MSFAPIEQIAECTDWPVDLPSEFPEFVDDMPEPPITTFDDRCERQAIEQTKWACDKIGTMPKHELFYAGLNPVDFIRAFHDKYTDIEQIDKLISLDAEGNTGKLFYTKMGLHHQHINNQFSDKELEGLCYERPGSKRWYTDQLTAKLGCNGDEIPLEVIDAIQECNIQKSLGRQSYRNFMRRINKSYEKKCGKPNKKGKKGKKWTVEHKNTTVHFK